MSDISTTKFNCLAARFSDAELRSTYTVSALAELFPGTTSEDWRSWQASGLIRLLPGTRKIALVDAVEFMVTAGENRAIPIEKRESNEDAELSAFEEMAISAINSERGSYGNMKKGRNTGYTCIS